MKNYGKIIEFDGYVGSILGIDGNEYLILNDEIIDKNIRVNDYVSFNSDIYKDVELTKYIARFIKKLSKDSN